MNPSRHLGDAHIDRFVSVADIPENERAAFIAHIADCPVCRDRLLTEIDPIEDTATRCPDPLVWSQLGAPKPPIDPLSLARHAATCDPCRELLHATLDCDGPLTAEEEQFLSALDIAKPLYQQHMAERMAGGVQPTFKLAPKRRWFSMRWLVSGAATAAVAAAVVGTLAYSHYQNSPDHVSKLLAQSYSEHRTLEARLPHADYAPLAQTRGANSTRPLPLIEAELAITKALAANPSDPRWLGQKAELLLLQNNLPEASKTIRRALDSDPQNPDLQGIEGAVDLQQGESGKSFSYAEAIESLSRAIKSRPNDPAFIFNRALAYEHSNLLPQAQADWETYLKLDPKGHWSNEVRTRLDQIRARISKQESLMKAPLVGPSEYLRISRSGTEDEKHHLLVNIDRYIWNALSDWLPSAYPPHGAGDPDTVSALSSLARVLNENGEASFQNMLSGASRKNFRAAATELAAAVRAMFSTGVADDIRPHAQSAIRLFHSDGNNSGEQLALAALIYAEHRAQNSSACLKEVAR
ncbi:MAG TPA: tetratricopeptide repeat protein, partial [Terriglobales bacterium]